MPTHSKAKVKAKARLLVLFFVFHLLLFSPVLFAKNDSCSHLSFDKRELVSHVYDGDTVKLANGEKIRLIGINTPEMNYDTSSPEPYAKKAKRFLEKHALNKRVGIKYGKERIDKYKRRLAHLFLLDGTNLQYEILKSGLAFNISIPPNLWLQSCYKSIEKQAKDNLQGIWKSPYFQPVKASKINKNKLGFKRVTGKITEVLKTRKTIWIKYSEKMALRINRKDLHYFENFKPKELIGKQVSAQGWISMYKKRFSMRITHPDTLTIH